MLTPDVGDPTACRTSIAAVDTREGVGTSVCCALLFILSYCLLPLRVVHTSWIFKSDSAMIANLAESPSTA